MKKIVYSAAVALISLSLALTGCAKKDDSAVLARVNRAKITAADFKRQLEDLDPRMQQAVASDPKARKEFLDDLIGIEVVLQEARRQGLDKDPEYKKRQEMIKKEMEKRVQDDARNELFNGLLKKELADKLGKMTPPTDEETKNYYTKNIDKMTTPDGRKLSYKEVEPQLKRRMMAEKQRDLYLQYAQQLKEKAKISIDEKALDATASSLTPSTPSGMDLQTMPVPSQNQGKKTK